PARPLRTFPEALAILLSVVVEDIVLARHVKDLLGFAALQNLLQRVELLGFGEMRQVAGVQHERGRVGQRVDFGHRLAQRRGDVLVRLLAEADMAVADLNKAEIRAGAYAVGIGRLAEALRAQNASRHRPKHSRAGPGHAFEEPATVDAV